MLRWIIWIADLFIPNNVANDPSLLKLKRRYQAVSRMLLIIAVNMIIFNIPLLLFGEPGRPLPLIVLAIVASVLLGIITMYIFQTFIIPLIIAVFGSVVFMFYGMLITGGIYSPFVFMLMTVPLVTITFGDAIVYKTLYGLIALSFLCVLILQYTGVISAEQLISVTRLEQSVSILGALSIIILGGIHTRHEIRGVRIALKLAKESAVNEARIDHLTKLCNRRAFMESGNIMIGQMERLHLANTDNASRQLYMLMLDIDFFKKVNDTYGHSVGDQVLIEVAKLLNNSTRNFEHVARIGGEEFALLFEGDNKQGALLAAERLRESIESLPIKVGDNNIPITISIGICQWSSGENINHLLKIADSALYEAKNSGRNRVVFN
jgi:diguanylate cyclase (GGDEF)-like protein